MFGEGRAGLERREAAEGEGVEVREVGAAEGVREGLGGVDGALWASAGALPATRCRVARARSMACVIRARLQAGRTEQVSRAE